MFVPKKPWWKKRGPVALLLVRWEVLRVPMSIKFRQSDCARCIVIHVAWLAQIFLVRGQQDAQLLKEGLRQQCQPRISKPIDQSGVRSISIYYLPLHGFEYRVFSSHNVISGSYFYSGPCNPSIPARSFWTRLRVLKTEILNDIWYFMILNFPDHCVFCWGHLLSAQQDEGQTLSVFLPPWPRMVPVTDVLRVVLGFHFVAVPKANLTTLSNWV